MKRLFNLLLLLTLAACNFPSQRLGATTPTPAASETPTPAYEECAFVEARQENPGLSSQFMQKLKDAGLPVETARAEAYGENCIAADNSVVRFAQREIDFYATLKVQNLSDEAALGDLLEKTLAVIDGFPPDQVGPNPGYIGITFQAGDQVQNLWFMQTQVNEFRQQGLKGAALYRALNNRP